MASLTTRVHVPTASRPAAASCQLVARPCSVQPMRRPMKVHAAAATVAAAAPSVAEKWNTRIYAPADLGSRSSLPELISKEEVEALESELDQGASIAALRRFNNNLRNIPADRWDAVLTPVFHELCYNLESFNPAFTACLLMVQRTIGSSDYVRRDMALKNLIQPLAGEYGMHNGQPQLKTHRELFSDFFASLFGYPLEKFLGDQEQLRGRPVAAERLWGQMERDITTAGGQAQLTPTEKACYALGYNLAIEYLADYEKTWMLDSFRQLDARIFRQLGKAIDWVFLEVHAEGEAEHAAIGHAAVLNFVPAAQSPLLRKAMRDHDRDFAAFYNRLADMMEQ